MTNTPNRTALACHILLGFVLAVGLVGWLGLSRPLASAEPASLDQSFASTAGPFLQQHCVRCHNADELTSGIRVDHLDAALEDRQLKLWQAIRQVLRKSSMPPEDEPQPTDAERQAMLGWIDTALDVAQSRPTPKNGSVRRLTVEQYRNTLRELLLLDDELTDTLPPDAVSRDGFLNNQETQVLSPLLVETYLDIAGKALDRCLVDPTARPVIQNFRMDLGRSINPQPCPDALILGANSLLLNNADFQVTQPIPAKSFAFESFAMQTKFRFIEGYQGNDTVRGWRDYDSIYHAVFACLRGAEGYPQGRAYSTVPDGLLLRPAIPSAELFGVDSTYGPRANFKISLRELPDHGRFRITVMAAKYDDGLLLDAQTPTQPEESAEAITVTAPQSATTVTMPQAGIYQIDLYAAKEAKPQEVTLQLGTREFIGTLQSPAFLVVRLPAGELPFRLTSPESMPVERCVATRLPDDHPLAQRFRVFEQRSPRVGVHLGLRRDCGSTLNPVSTPQAVTSTELRPYIFEGAIRNFPSPDVEADNVNYLAGIREIGVRSEYTDGRDMPQLLIRSVEFEGPYYDDWPPATHRNLITEAESQASTPEAAQQVIRRFATRAFRRPITDQEATSLMAVFEEAQAQGESWQNSVKDALQVTLTSPQFLFLTEASSTPDAEPLNDYELAAKLAYFLWNGPPDDELLELAATGALRAQLDDQLTRMVASPKFHRFVEDFATQWLSLDKLAVLEPDRKQFPRLTRDARLHLKQEPVMFLEHLLRENLPSRHLIQSDFIVANEVVASYYNLADQTESGWEFIPIPHQQPELGGVLSQAAILAGLSDGREANPVKRGAWVARKIVAEPPDDPPPNVPTLPEDRSLSLRARLELHRNQTGCAQCHAKIDPWGLPFEAFDAGGRWKQEAVDASSVLPDNTPVADYHALRRYLAEDRIDQVAFSVLKHLTTYAIGRTLTYRELADLKRESEQRRETEYPLQDLLRFVVQSPMFLEK
ncbi:DUF1592 domain-containing protein [bacterium]|nr:DUF1592 domain-containing protein [bacterium]